MVCVDPHDIPVVAFVDPDMMATMPASLTAATGMDALTHAIEGYITGGAWELSDMFHIKAIEIIAKNLRAAVKGDAAGMEGMIGGQIVDILSEDKESISEEELRFMHACKTGELIRASIVAGAVLGEASNQDIEKLDLFGRKLGLAFQIKDDILDIIGDVKKLGKNIQKDAGENKCNFITVYGLEKCKKMCEDLSNECIEILDSIDKDTKELKEITIKLLNREK